MQKMRKEGTMLYASVCYMNIFLYSLHIAGLKETGCCLFYDAAKFSKLKSIRDEYKDSAFVQRAFGDVCLTSSDAQEVGKYWIVTP